MKCSDCWVISRLGIVKCQCTRFKSSLVCGSLWECIVLQFDSENHVLVVKNATPFGKDATQ